MFFDEPEQEEPKHQMNWVAYYREFERIHGKPVLYRGRFLYRDGYQYSSTDYEGPEWPPPEDEAERDHLIRRYWRIHAARLLREITDLRSEYEALVAIQSTRSGPLFETIERFDPEEGRFVEEVVKLDLAAMNETLTRLEQDHREARAEYSRIKSKGEN